MDAQRDEPVSIGEVAPDFSLPAVDDARHVSLADYRGKTAVLLALFRGLQCPFCRQQIAQLGASADRLRAAGLEVVGVINTPRERAALFLRYRPARILLVADPDLATHRAYGLPRVQAMLRDGDAEIPAEGAQLVGHFVIDRHGIVRWRYVEGAALGGRETRFPSPQELVRVARGLGGTQARAPEEEATA